jgi:hypothetical protein
MILLLLLVREQDNYCSSWYIFGKKVSRKKKSSGSNVILEEIQDTSHNTISDTDQINPSLDSSANEHLEEPNP